MVIDWEHLAVLTGKGVLLVLEYMVKLSAFVVTAIVLSANGTFGGKLGAGFSSLSAGLRNVFGVPGDLAILMGELRTYRADAASFIWEPGGYEALNSILAYLNGSILYLDAVGANFSNQPFTTFFAAVIGFFSLYLTARLLRFYRQKGQGSRLLNMEQKLGERVFRKPAEFQKPPAPKPAAAAAAVKEIEEKPAPRQESNSGPRTVKPAFSAGSENKFLQDYIRLAQNGGG
ncbi:hypothetical protein [Rhodohalobacter mucosus]|uniref:Uncharacterized protein n=1 Tax=Rhodohalobacter mucosus TaxID=2079485 RepID=A0A316TY39_9BACT|nr:hypothetical protein [Rhodohalobacter mucosus]PWN07692.1 hypothetical protein DDZ15_01315 [Rhodohalobacter mucosus]